MSDSCYFCRESCYNHKTKRELKYAARDIRVKSHRRFDPECKLIKPCKSLLLLDLFPIEHVVCKKCYPYIKGYCGICNGWSEPIDTDLMIWDSKLDLCSKKADEITKESISRKIIILKERVISILQWYYSDETLEFLQERKRLHKFTQQLVDAINLFRAHLRVHLFTETGNHYILSYFKLQSVIVTNELKQYQTAILEALVGPAIKRNVIGQLNLIDSAINQLNDTYQLYDTFINRFNYSLIDSLQIPLDLQQQIIKYKSCFFCKQLYFKHYILEYRLTHLGKRKVRRCHSCIRDIKS